MAHHPRNNEILYPFSDPDSAYGLFFLSFNELVNGTQRYTGDIAQALKEATADLGTDSRWKDRVIVNRRGDEIFRSSTLLLSPDIDRMLSLMMKRHEGQMRKGDGADYREHPLEVSHILRQYGFDAETVAGGLGHDLLEDTTATEEEIALAGGKEVLELVKTMTQPKIDDWHSKKVLHVAQIREAGVRAAAVFTADHIANLRSIIWGSHRQGENFWKHFNAGKEGRLWYERMGLEMVQWQLMQHPMVEEYARLVGRMENS